MELCRRVRKARLQGALLSIGLLATKLVEICENDNLVPTRALSFIYIEGQFPNRTSNYKASRFNEKSRSAHIRPRAHTLNFELRRPLIDQYASLNQRLITLSLGRKLRDKRLRSQRVADALLLRGGGQVRSKRPKTKKTDQNITQSDVWQMAEEIITNLRANPLAPPFNQPVDPVALNLPNYHQIIKEPMDLGTIAKKLKERKYNSPKEVKLDVYLIVSNCELYNTRASYISRVATNLKTVFMRAWVSERIEFLWDRILSREKPRLQHKHGRPKKFIQDADELSLGMNGNVSIVSALGANGSVFVPLRNEEDERIKAEIESLGDRSSQTLSKKAQAKILASHPVELLQIWERVLECIDGLLESPLSSIFSGRLYRDFFIEKYGQDPGCLDILEIRRQIYWKVADLSSKTLYHQNQSFIEYHNKTHSGGNRTFSTTEDIRKNSTGNTLPQNTTRDKEAGGENTKNLSSTSPVTVTMSSGSRINAGSSYLVPGDVYNAIIELFGHVDNVNTIVARSGPMDNSTILNTKLELSPKKELSIAISDLVKAWNAGKGMLVVTWEELWKASYVEEGWGELLEERVRSRGIKVKRERFWTTFTPILRTWMKRPGIQPFLNPVIGVSGYRERISKPMSFEEIVLKLKKNIYDDFRDVLSDIRQIWLNCLIFNGINHPLTKTAVNLDNGIRSDIQKMKLLENWDTVSAIVFPRLPPFMTYLKRVEQQHSQAETVNQTTGTLNSDISPQMGFRGRPEFVKIILPGIDVSIKALLIQEKLSSALRTLMRMKEALPFSSPVSPNVPAYRAVVDFPQDLKSIHDSLRSAPSPLVVDRNVRQIFYNSELFNSVDSELVRDAKILKERWEALWRESNVMQEYAECVKFPPKRLKVRTEECVEHFYYDHRAMTSAFDMGLTSTYDISRLNFESVVPSWVPKAREVIKALIKRPDTTAFRISIDRTLNGRGSHVQRPMDLGTILKRIKQAKYTKPSHVKFDLDCIWENAKAFYSQKSKLFNKTLNVEIYANDLWSKSDLPMLSEDPHQLRSESVFPEESHISEMSISRDPSPMIRRPLRRRQSSQKGDPIPNWEAIAIMLVNQLKASPHAVPFMTPVPDSVYDYYRIISEPMDLGTILSRLQGAIDSRNDTVEDPRFSRQDLFKDPGEFRDAVSLVWKNCKRFNPKGSPLYNLGSNMENLWATYWENSVFHTKGWGDASYKESSSTIGEFREKNTPTLQMSHEEKMRIAKRITLLDEDRATGLVAAVAPECMDDPEYIIDMDILRPSQLAAIRQYLDAVSPEYDEKRIINYFLDEKSNPRDLFHLANRTVAGRFALGDDSGASADPLANSAKRYGFFSSASSKRKKTDPNKVIWRKIRFFLVGFRKRRQAAPFNQPVDPVALKIPQYLQIVKHPMDFGTIEAKIRSEAYKGNPLLFRDDMRRVFENSRLFNQPGHWVRRWSEELSDIFETWWSKTGIETPFGNDENPGSEKNLQEISQLFGDEEGSLRNDSDEEDVDAAEAMDGVFEANTGMDFPKQNQSVAAGGQEEFSNFHDLENVEETAGIDYDDANDWDDDECG